MSIGITTMGMFRYQFHQNWQQDAVGGGGGGYGIDHKKQKPVVVLRRVNSHIKQKPKIKVTEVIYD